MTGPSEQAPPGQGSGAPPVEDPPVGAERKVVERGGGEGTAAAPTDAANPGRHYPNPWISEGGKCDSP